MNIRDKKIRQAINEVIKESVKSGHLLNSSEVLSLLSRKISSHNLANPSFEFVHMHNNFSVDSINNARQLLSEDFSIIYDCIADLSKETEKQVKKFEVEKQRHDYLINDLESELMNLVSKYSVSSYVDTAIESIIDMQSFNMNLSDADIDLQNKEITLKKLSAKPINSIASISYKTTGQSSIVVNGEIEDYINTEGSNWQCIIGKPLQETTDLEILIDVGATTAINKVELVFPLIKPSAISVKTSLDSHKWNEGYTGVISERCAIDLNSSFRYISITISKVEADKYKDESFQYYFIIDTIRLYQINYAISSTIVSEPIKMTSNINKVSLFEDAVKPPGTNIRFSVALNTEKPEWIPITPVNSPSLGDKVINFNTVESGQILDISLPVGISNEAYELKNYSTNGQRIYQIKEITDRAIVRGTLFKGINAWKCDRLLRVHDSTIDKSIFIENARDITTSYSSLLLGRPSLILNNTEFSEPALLKYTLAMECPNTDQIIKSPIISNYPVTIYLNGNLLYKGIPSSYTPITYPFKAKKNVLEVLVNINRQNDGAFASATVDLNTDLFSLSSSMYGNPDPLQEVSLFNLRYNTNNQKDVYALRDTNNGKGILVKDEDLRIDYRYIYDYIIEDTSEILVKALLQREYNSINITPKLKGYELRMM